MFEWEVLLNGIKPVIKMGLILLIGHFAVIYIMKIINRGLGHGNLDESLKGFITKAFNIVGHVLVILSALNSIGISTSGIIAALSAATVAVALALKDSLSNVAGGILLLISPRFSTGNYIKTENDEGTVISVDLLHTTIKTADNKQISIPNGILINSHIINYSIEPKRRVDITFGISYDADPEKAKKVIYETIQKHPCVINEPEKPLVRVIGYGDSSVNVVTRSWCNNTDYWTVYFDLTEQIRTDLEREGITIPYNQLDVNIKNNN